MIAAMQTDIRREPKLKLGFYPYLITRARAMKSKLIERDTYHKLIKMNLDEIAKFMGETEYKREIDELAMTYSGVDLIEMTLNLNLKRAFRKLIKISDEEIQVLIKEYLKKWDVWNFKTILRGKASGANDDEIKSLIIAGGEFRYHYFAGILKKDFYEIIESVPFLKNCPGMDEGLEEYEKTGSLMKIENALDKQYYRGLLLLADRIPREGEPFRTFIRTELDILSIKNLLRLKRERFDKERIMDNLIPGGEQLKIREFERLASCESLDEMMKVLSKTRYGKIIEKYAEDLRESNELYPIEIMLEKYWLHQAYHMLRQHPLTVNPVMGYMVAKEIEVKNVRMIARAKQSGLDEAFMKENLVV